MPGGLVGALSTSLRRGLPPTLVSSLLVVETPGGPGEKGVGMPERVEVVGEESNPDLTGVCRVNGGGLAEVPSSLAVLVL